MGKQATRASIQWHIKSDFKAVVFQSALTKDWPILGPPLQSALVLGPMQTARTSACVDALDIWFYLRFAIRIRVDSKGLHCWHYLLKASEIFIMPSNKRQGSTQRASTLSQTLTGLADFVIDFLVPFKTV